MDCQAAREKIGPYLDGELSAEQQQALQLHLDGCAQCAAELERLRKVPELRMDKIRAAQKAILEGTYLTPDNLDRAILRAAEEGDL